MREGVRWYDHAEMVGCMQKMKMLAGAHLLKYGIKKAVILS